jgi:hypothetical protein
MVQLLWQNSVQHGHRLTAATNDRTSTNAIDCTHLGAVRKERHMARSVTLCLCTCFKQNGRVLELFVAYAKLIGSSNQH